MKIKEIFHNVPFKGRKKKGAKRLLGFESSIEGFEDEDIQINTNFKDIQNKKSPNVKNLKPNKRNSVKHKKLF